MIDVEQVYNTNKDFKEYCDSISMNQFVCKDFKSHIMAQYVAEYYVNIPKVTHSNSAESSTELSVNCS